VTQRHLGRETALQILYFCEVARTTPDVALGAFFKEHLPDADEQLREFVGTLVRGTLDDGAALDELISAQSQNWRLERLAAIDRIILRMAIWELQHEPETPPAVIIDEAVELARTFSSDRSVGFVNGVLDGVRKTLEGSTG
jgi:N utilization substance protein B